MSYMIDIDEGTKVLIAKPVSTALVAGLVDRFFMGNPNFTDNLYFGSIVGACVFVADIVAKHSPIDSVVGKSLEQRALELGVTVPATFMLQKYLYNTPTGYRPGKRVLAIVGSDMAGEYIANSFLGLA